jgi:acetyltransferase-like isoleucine patch superfamily enzyme
MLGFQIGQNVFIGMKCYMDDVDPKKTIIEDDVVISYGCYFACHGKGQGHTSIVIEQGAYLGMRCNVVSGRDGIVIGKNVIVGAGSLVNKSIPENSSVAGVPAKMILNEK